jgi:hypothetical protein
MPVAYVQQGHDNEAWSNPAFRTLLGNAIKWAASTEAKDWTHAHPKRRLVRLTISHIALFAEPHARYASIAGNPALTQPGIIRAASARCAEWLRDCRGDPDADAAGGQFAGRSAP